MAARSKWIDITMEFGAPQGTWPGDTPFSAEFTGRIGKGKWGVNLTQFQSSPHNGTHSDAPMHVVPGAPASESLDPDAYLGPCVVVDATGAEGSTLHPSLAVKAERVLYRTHGKQNVRFPKSFKGLGEDLARRLVRSKVRLVGTDAPSVDAFDSKDLVAHKALFGGGASIVENLDLSQARPGRYELVALPLKVRGLCAAPVRALLRPL